MSAIISNCKRYRYQLSREGEGSSTDRGPAVFVMLNPSTADATVDDPTITRCRGFAKAWGYSGIIVANLYAWRATAPSELKKAEDPVGPYNDVHLSRLANSNADFVVAWGNNAPMDRVTRVVKILKKSGASLWCLGVTKNGAPRHPLYVAGDTPLQAWVLPARARTQS